MNKIYKIIWSKTRNCYVVVSEYAKRNGKCSSSMNKKLIAAFLAAGTVMSITGSAWAESYAAGGGTATGTDAVAIGASANASGDFALVIGASANSKGIASTIVGKGSVINKNTSYKYQGLAANIFGEYNTIKAYNNSGYAYDGVSNSIVGVGNTTERANGALILGDANNVTYAYGDISTDEAVTAALAAYEANPTAANYTALQKAIANAAAKSGGNIIAVGDRNTVQYANSSTVIGAGNSLKGYSATSIASNLYVNGNTNTLQYVNDSSIVGSGNTVKGYSSSYYSANTYVTGNDNTATYTKNVTVIGSDNTVGRNSSSSAKDTIIIGDSNKIGTGSSIADNVIIGNNHTVAKTSKNVIIGNAAEEMTTSVASVVALGYGANVTKAGGVALGSDSIASAASSIKGYDPATGKQTTSTTPVWRSTLGAISVGAAETTTTDEEGNTTTIPQKTRQITNVAAGYEDTDAVNVAQLKKVAESAKPHYFGVKSTISSEGSNYNGEGATGSNAIAVGAKAQASNTSSIAIGYGTKASGYASIAIGQEGTWANTTATGSDSIAIGRGAQALADGAIAIGSGDTGQLIASGENSYVHGDSAIAAGENATAWGELTQAGQDEEGKQSTIELLQSFDPAAVHPGTETREFGKSATAWGEDTKAYGSRSTAWGKHNKAYGIDSTAWGSLSDAFGRGSTAFGLQTRALGDNSTAWGYESFAFGRQATAWGSHTLVVDVAGNPDMVQSATAFGESTLAANAGATAFGNSTTAQGAYSTAFGSGSVASGSSSTAFGDNSYAFGDNSLAALGGYTGYGVASGFTTSNYFIYSDEVDEDANPVYHFNKMVYSTSINAEGAVALGEGAWAIRDHTYAIGKGAQAYAGETIAIGNKAIAKGIISTVVGNGSQLNTTGLQGATASVFGAQNTITGVTDVTSDGVANSIFGVGNSTSNANSAVVLGAGNVVQDAYEDFGTGIKDAWNARAAAKTALETAKTNYQEVNAAYLSGEATLDEKNAAYNAWQQAQTDFAASETALADAVKEDVPNKGGRAIAIGSGNTVQAMKGIAIGNGSTVSGENSIAIGTGHTVSGKNSGAFGDPDNVYANASYAVGNNNTIGVEDDKTKGINTFVMGNNVTTTEEGTVVVGHHAESNTHTFGKNSVSLGTDAVATVDNSVALGAGSVADRAASTGGYNVLTGESDYVDTSNESAWKAGNAAVSVGSSSATRQIVNVAAGTELTDAVNVAQLKQVASGLTHYYHVNDGGTAQGNYDNDGAKARYALAAGANVSAKGIASAVTGTGSTVEGDGASGISVFPEIAGAQGATASIYGAFNTVAIGENGATYDGVANSLIGTANTTENANGALIWGAGNEIKNSYADVQFTPAQLMELATAARAKDYGKMANILASAVAGSGGNAMAVGGANKIDSAKYSQVIGVSNTLTGTTDMPSEYNLVNGFQNTASDVQNTAIVGSNNTVSSSKDVIIAGNNRTVTGVTNNVILGSATAEAGLTTSVSKAVILGTDANVSVEGGVALGAGSVADRAASTGGYNALTGSKEYVDANNESAWKAGTAAVSIGGTGTDEEGNTTTVTRQITNVAAGTEETDAVNVAQLKQVAEGGLKFGGDNTTPDTNIITRKLGQQLDIIGGANPKNLTDDNIAVISNGIDTLEVKLSDKINLTTDGSLTVGEAAKGATVVYQKGIRIIPETGTSMTQFTSEGISAGNQKIEFVKAGEADTDAVNVSQLKKARTTVTAGANVTSVNEVPPTDVDGNYTYKIDVDDLSYKANGSNAQSVKLSDGLNFSDGTNTTAVVEANGVVKINATHNKVTGGTATEATDTSNAVSLTLTDEDGNTIPSIGLKNTYTTVTKEGNTVTFSRNDGVKETISLSDLGASDYAVEEQKVSVDADGKVTLKASDRMNPDETYNVVIDGIATKDDVAKKIKFADSTGNYFEAGLGEEVNVVGEKGVTVTTNNSNNTYTIGIDGAAAAAEIPLTYKANGSNAQSVKLSDGLNFSDGTNTTAVVEANGVVKINATHNKVTGGTATEATDTSNAVSLTLTDEDGNTIPSIGLKNTYTTVTKEGNTVTFSRNDGVKETISLGDLGASDYRLVPAEGGNYKADEKGVVTMQVKDALNENASPVDVTIEDVASKAQQDTNTQNIATNTENISTNTQNIAANRADIDAGWNAKAGGSTINVNPQHKDLTFAGADEHVTVTADDTTRTVKVGVTGLANEDLSNITEEGETVITNIARDAVTVKGEGGIEVTQSEDKSTYTAKAKLAKNLTLREGNIDLANVVKIGNGTDVHTVTIDGTKGEVTGLTNTTWSKDGVYNAGRAATEEQLQDLYEAATKDAVDSVKLKFEGETGDTLERGNNETLQIVGDGTNITTKAADGKIKVELAKDLNVDSVTAGNTVINNEGVKADKVTVGGTTIEDKKITLGDTVVDDASVTTGSVAADDAQIGNTTIDKDGIDTNKVTVGDVTINNDGLNIEGGPSVTKDGVDAGGSKITNVAKGTEDTDAVNLSQLKEATAASKTEVVKGTNIASVESSTGSDGQTIYTVNADGASVSGSDAITVTKGAKDAQNVTDYKVDLSDKTKETLDKVENEGLTFAGDTGASDVIKLGDTLNLKGGATGDLSDGNIGVEAKGNTLNIKLAKDIKDVDTIQVNKSITAGDTVINNDGVTANTFKAGDTTVSNDGLTIVDGPSITKTNVDMGSQQIHNVQAGTADTDAVNYGQLKDLAKNTGDAITNVSNQISKVDDRMKKGLAGAAALAALHPMDFDPDSKLTFAAGVGNYRGANAGAVGAFYRPDERVMFSMGGSFGNGENMVNAGVSFALDRVNRISNTRTAMAHEIVELKGHIAKQDEQIAKLTALVNKLVGPEQAINDSSMFPDVPENHWAYEYVADLQRRGALVGYPDGLFKGDRAMTRYEFAAMLDRAMQNGVKLDERAAKEFEPELGRIYIQRISGQDNDRNKIERVRVNNYDKATRDMYGSKISTAVPVKAASK